MNITLVVVGKTDVKFVQEGCEIYLSRLKHYTHFAMEVVPAAKGAVTPSEAKEREGRLLLKKMEQADCAVLLDEHGTQRTSTQFAQHLQRKMNAGTRQLTFVIGGAFGVSDEVKRAATETMSLSDMTFNHQMARVFFLEQLYRAFTILRNEKYHNE
ncbi:MAG: 23S rRNA (pseudouridine(1915)-N(3))-methyltransferase RlmH [Bacteroidales bacterium]|nr:23S rRNA (pseudouridine(1915)-N(3))-methyltransferase RlmH [Bacteroidales bacterium]